MATYIYIFNIRTRNKTDEPLGQQGLIFESYQVHSTATWTLIGTAIAVT
jgi:hypothetical protein